MEANTLTEGWRPDFLIPNWYLSATGELMALAAGRLEPNTGTDHGEPVMNALATSLQTNFATYWRVALSGRASRW